jgi:hypothetical protein
MKVRLRTLPTIFPAFVAAAAVSVSGCGEQARTKSAARENHYISNVPASAPGLINDAAAGGEAAKSQVNARFVGFQAPASAPRKIIYEAEISLVVKKMAETEAQITKLLKQHDGYVADANVDRRQGEELTGRWKVRVPAGQFDAFLDEVSKLGIAESRRQTAQDVTEEFVDLEAQISNKKKLEERIVALLKDASGTIKDVIEVERELARVRGEVEQMEGRLRYLTNRTDLTTISIVAREEENYVPPAAPTFANRIVQAWNSSLASLRTFGERLVVAVVAAFPWLVVASAVLVPTAWYVRKRNAGARSAPADLKSGSKPAT